MTLTSRVAEFNDLDGLERELAHGDVAAVLMEPALTNIGIVLPEPGYLDGVRELTRRHGTLLINDETHTFSRRPRRRDRRLGADAGHPHHRQGHRRRDPGRGLRPLGRAVRPAARPVRPRPDRHGRRRRHAGRQRAVGGRDAGDTGAGAHRRGLRGMCALSERFAAGVRDGIAKHGLPWSVSRLGARGEYRFADPAPRTGTESAASARRRARGLPAPLHGQPGHPDDARSTTWR